MKILTESRNKDTSIERGAISISNVEVSYHKPGVWKAVEEMYELLLEDDRKNITIGSVR